MLLAAPSGWVANGSPLWTQFSSGAAGGDDGATAIAVDTSGNVVVTGYSVGIGSDYDYLTVKYSPTGIPLWSKRFSSPGSNVDEAHGVAIDSQGNIYVSGTAFYSGAGWDWLTVKYSPDGTLLWSRRYNGTGNGEDQFIGLVLDSSDNVYLTGSSTGVGGAFDFVTLKLSSNGEGVWTNRYSGIAGNPLFSTDSPSGIAVDSEGNIYVTGLSFREKTDFDWATLKYSPTGTPLWTNRFNGSGNGYDQANALAIDAQGRISVTGLSTGTATGWDWVTIQYAATGVPLWTNRFSGVGRGNDSPNTIGVDAAGDVFVSGNFTTPAGDYDWATIKYSAGGVPIWTNTFGGVSHRLDYPVKLVVDDVGNVCVTGIVYQDVWSDVLTINYSSSGNVLWSDILPNPAKLDNAANAIAHDSNGAIYLTGYSLRGSNDPDFMTVKYPGPILPLRFIAPPSVLNPTNNHLTVMLTGPSGSNAVISVSSDLKLWIPLVTNRISGDKLQFTDPSELQGLPRFYRANLQ